MAAASTSWDCISTFSLGRPQEAGPHYQLAYELEPNNAVIVKDYLMWLDVQMDDKPKLERLMLPRKFTQGDFRSFLDLKDAHLACEAAVPALHLLHDSAWSQALWQFAVEHGMSSLCVEHNWRLFNSGQTLLETLGPIGAFLRGFWGRGRRSYLQSMLSNGVRFKNSSRSWNYGLAASSRIHEAAS